MVPTLKKSLAALSSIGSVREELASVADDELHASLALVSAGRREGDDPLKTVGPSSLGFSASTGAHSASFVFMPGADWARSRWPWTRS